MLDSVEVKMLRLEAARGEQFRRPVVAISQLDIDAEHDMPRLLNQKE